MAELLELQTSVAGAENAHELRELSRERRRLVSVLVQRARKVLNENEHAPSPQTMGRIEATLLAATSPGERELLRTGRLQKELTGGGFDTGIWGAMEPRAESQATGPTPSRTRRRDLERAEKLEAEAHAATREAAELRTAAGRLRRKAKRAEAQASEVEGRAERAESKAAEARNKLDP